jgi:PAS domain S-box-containing protein
MDFIVGGGGRRRRLPILGARPTVGFTAVLAVVLTVLPFVFVHMSALPVLSFMVAIGLCAARFGLPGGLVSGGLGVGVATVWLVHGDRFGGGWVEYGSQSTAFLVVGALVGSSVSERQALEDAVTRHHELSLDLICTATFDGYFTRLNPAWKKVLGYDLDELCAKPFLEFVHPDDREATLSEAERQTIAGREVINFQNRYRCKDGSYKWLEWTSRPDDSRRLLFAVARDVTARKHSEQALAEYHETLERAVQERTAELEEARLEVLQRLALAAEYRDDDTFEHTRRVGNTAALLARKLGLPEVVAATLRQAAQLHDVGKLGISDTILLKPGKLTAAEFAIVQRHAIDGAKILSGSRSDVLQLAEEIALGHHERWDGTGYPHQLEREHIPLAARIVAVADVFDALTHSRPYKQAWPVERAAAEIRNGSGTHFDPAIVEAFNTLNPHVLAGATPGSQHQQAA